VAVEVAADCAAVDAGQLTRLLRVERLKTGVLEGVWLEVSVRCASDTASLRITRREADGATVQRERAFRSRDVSGEVGARVLALAAVELLGELDAAPPVALGAEPPPWRPVLSTPTLPERRLASVRLMAAGGLQSISLEQPLIAGGLSVDYVRIPSWGLRVEANLAVSERSYPLGDARLQLMTMSAQVGYLAIHERWTVRGLLGYRLGSGHISGRSAPGVAAREGSVAGPWGGPLLSGGLGLRRGSWVTELAAEAGWVAFPIEGRVEGERSVDFGGYWLGLSLNAGALL
jgi:hypothetical protein